MTDLITTNTQTITSLELRDIINTAREQYNESKVRNDQLLARIEDELEGELGGCKTFAPEKGGTPMRYYDLNPEQCTLVGMRESKGVRRKVLDILKKKQSKQAMAALPNFNNPVEAARAWADEVEQKQIAQQALALAAPKAEFYDAVTQSGDAISMDEVAKVLNLPGLGRNKLFRLLREKGVLQSGGVKHNQPYQRHVDAGRFRLVETSWVADNGDVRVNLKTVVLQKGLDYIRKIASE